MSTGGVPKCTFCDIVWNRPEQHLKATEKVVMIKDRSPHAPHHYLALSKCHINRPGDLRAVDVELVEEMERLGRELLREKLKEKGQADTVEDMLRMGFHYPPLTSVNHLHMHLLYPVNELSFLNKAVVFRPSRFFRLTKEVLDDLKGKRGDQPDNGNPALNPEIADSSMK
uniref:Adenosine 5'-monophosphoramidase HINT3 n=1 Tax=Steinernema glaseri TaxID=37863 RepID=A0A1I8ALF9_9BILA